MRQRVYSWVDCRRIRTRHLILERSYVGQIKSSVVDPHANPDTATVFGSRAMMTKNCTILQLRKKKKCDQKPQTIYPQVSMIDVRTIGETFGPQKRTSSTQNMKYHFGLFCGSFFPSSQPKFLRIRIQKLQKKTVFLGQVCGFVPVFRWVSGPGIPNSRGPNGPPKRKERLRCVADSNPSQLLIRIRLPCIDCYPALQSSNIESSYLRPFFLPDLDPLNNFIRIHNQGFERTPCQIRHKNSNFQYVEYKHTVSFIHILNL